VSSPQAARGSAAASSHAWIDVRRGAVGVMSTSSGEDTPGRPAGAPRGRRVS
jgi:hypothetical protein